MSRLYLSTKSLSGVYDGIDISVKIGGVVRWKGTSIRSSCEIGNHVKIHVAFKSLSGV